MGLPINSLLPLKLLDPPRLHSDIQNYDSWNTACWYAVYTRSRHEKHVEHELSRKGLETFLPLRRVTRNWSDRRKIIEEPLFRGYLFVHLSIRERLAVLKTGGIVGFVGPSQSKPIEVPESEISAVRRLVEEDMQIDPFPYLKEGERVYIRSGPFKGIEGFIIRKDKHCRLVISLNLLMQSLSIQVDSACVESI